jgi:hypothetical protein
MTIKRNYVSKVKLWGYDSVQFSGFTVYLYRLDWVPMSSSFLYYLATFLTQNRSCFFLKFYKLKLDNLM